MELLTKDKMLKVMSVTRFHFVAGLPTAGADDLTRILAQNPALVARSDTAAEKVYAEIEGSFDYPSSALHTVDAESRAALLRSTLDAMFHSRAMDQAVIDNNPGWMARMGQLAQLMPLTRFVFMVRDPAAIAADLARNTGEAQSPKSLMASDGVIGAPLAHLHMALTDPNSKRVMIVERDRLLAHPDKTLAAIYAFLREPQFAHDIDGLPAPQDGTPPPHVKGLRRIISTSGLISKRRDAGAQVPVWRRSIGTEAALLLAETG